MYVINTEVRMLMGQSDKISHIDSVIFHFDTVILRIDNVILRSSSV